MEGRDLFLSNIMRFSRAPKCFQGGFSVKKKDGSLGPLSQLFKCGTTKEFLLHINTNRDLLFKVIFYFLSLYCHFKPKSAELLLTMDAFPFFLNTAPKWRF